jgi:hypothetical protein
MRLILRVLGTWLIALAVVLLVVDGTKSLGANNIVLTSLGALWAQINQSSLETVREFFAGRFFADLLDNGFSGVLSYPAFAVFGVPGIVFSLLGRTPPQVRYVQQDQI